MKILITGCAGFIGFSLAKALLEKKNFVIGIDNYDDYYSVKLKKKRISLLKKFKSFKFIKVDISNEILLKKNLKKKKIDIIFHFAAQAGVRYSLVNPQKYIKSNLSGFCNLIDSVKDIKVKKLIYASSSSVYGESKNFPLSEKQPIKPKNIYGMTKKFNEELAENYSKLYNIDMIGLRFFTIFGEWGRPDMFVTKYLTSSFKKKFFILIIVEITKEILLIFKI
jgi:UDP-glucuronate 4-epimerase